jgi:hypothetical protein
VLHLPHVAELVRDEVVLLVRPDRTPQQDQAVGGVAVEAGEPGQAVERRAGDDPDARDPHRARVEVEPVEAGASALERRPGRPGHEPVGGLNTSQTPPSWPRVKLNR